MSVVVSTKGGEDDLTCHLTINLLDDMIVKFYNFITFGITDSYI